VSGDYLVEMYGEGSSNASGHHRNIASVKGTKETGCTDSMENSVINVMFQEKCLPVRVLVFVMLAVFIQACSKPDIFVEEERFIEAEVKGNAALHKGHLQQGDFSLKYVSAGSRSGPVIVYLHGTPGGWGNGVRYLTDTGLQAVAQVVSLDRPGWGGSILNADNELGSFAQQNRLLKPLIEKLHRENNGKGVILVGHSLGASLAPYLVMENPELISGLVLLAGSLDPALGKPRWYNWAASMGVVSWFLGSDMQKANREIMRLEAQLEVMRSGWADITIPVTVVQGLRDKLVSPGNADFAEQVLINADLTIIRLATANHFIPWENRELVIREIHLMLEKLGR